MNDSDIAQRGLLAAQAKAELHRRVTERAESVLSNAVMQSISKDGISGDEAKAAIVAIRELRRLLEDVNRDIRQGEQARGTLMAPSR